MQFFLSALLRFFDYDRQVPTLKVILGVHDVPYMKLLHSTVVLDDIWVLIQVNFRSDL